jgi:hypothetical protein
MRTRECVARISDCVVGGGHAGLSVSRGVGSGEKSGCGGFSFRLRGRLEGRGGDSLRFRLVVRVEAAGPIEGAVGELAVYFRQSHVHRLKKLI